MLKLPRYISPTGTWFLIKSRQQLSNENLVCNKIPCRIRTTKNLGFCHQNPYTEGGSCSNLVFNKISGIICPITTWSEGTHCISPKRTWCLGKSSKVSCWQNPSTLTNSSEVLFSQTLVGEIWQLSIGCCC